jgi:hypothetical protein
MMRRALALPFLALALPATAQEPVYQTEPRFKFEFTGDALARYEWTRDFPPGTNDDRWRLQARPRLELAIHEFGLGVGADANYSQDENTEPPPNVRVQPLIRDNYDSRDIRVDLAFARFESSAVKLEAGRIAQPIPFTEMIWDRDLRAQGGALTLSVKNKGALERLALTGLYSQGSHVFDDQDTQTIAAAADATFKTGEKTRLELMAAYLHWNELTGLEPRIRRQNNRVAPGGAVRGPFDVIDGIVRFRHDGSLPLQVVGDFCINTAVDDQNQGLWAALVVGALKSTRVRGEYVFAQVDRDATLAAYATDDFLWATGWQGHRLDIGVRATDHASLHAIGQLQRFKDSLLASEREDWIHRYRLELRLTL